ncbi:MAG: N-methyl-L-tryptophan oxidase [Planctomycetota bacterium]
MRHYEAIVLGAGGVGSAALWHLAQRGIRAVALDRFPPPHSYGSSHGQSRIIRQAYFEHPEYVPLVLEAYRLWDELSQHLDQPLYHQQGVLQIGPADGEVVAGVIQAAEQHNLSIDRLSPQEIETRWPTLRVPEDAIGVFESQAGYLLVEQCVDAHLHAALGAGAEVHSPVEVFSWQPGPPVSVQTSEGHYTADRLIITSGAWSGQLLEGLSLELTVLRKSLFWLTPDAGTLARLDGLPCFLFDLPDGVFYGMPPIDERGVKIAEHSGGQPVDDPLLVSRKVDPEDLQRVRDFTKQQFAAHSVCLYTMSEDGHFVVDRHPDHEHIVFAAGLSGHGFKFSSVLGQAMADIAMTGQTNLPVGFLKCR